MRRTFTAILAIAAAILFVPSLAARGENWPGWRGPNRNSISAEKGIPLKWSAQEGILWRVPLIDSGGSSPIVWDDKVFVTASDGPKKANLHIICYSRDSGLEVWHRRFWGTAPTLYHDSKSSMATPAPVTDGFNVYAFFGTGDVFSVDFRGNLIWQRSLATEYGAFENRFAATSSPLLADNALILQCDHYGASYLLALDRGKGTNLWKTDRPECWHSWSSPQLVPADNGKRREIVLAGSHKLDAFDPATGGKLWTVQGMARECIPTPVFGNGMIYAVSGPNFPTLAVSPGGKGDVTETHVKWKNQRGAPFVPSAIVVGDGYYVVDDQGIGTCLDAMTGKVRWQKRFMGAFTASPVATEGRVYFTDESGATTVIAANATKCETLARNTVDEPVFATPAISQGRIFMRTDKHLLCIDGTSGKR